MISLEEFLGGKDEIWFEIEKTNFNIFVKFAKENKLKWKWGGDKIKIEDFDNHTHFAHISVTSKGICCFVPMFMWIDKKYNNLKLEFKQ